MAAAVAVAAATAAAIPARANTPNPVLLSQTRALGAEGRGHAGKSPDRPGGQVLGRPAKARDAKRAALAGCDRPNRVAVAKREAAARHRGERSAVGRNRVRVAPRKSAIKRELERTRFWVRKNLGRAGFEPAKA